MGKLERVVIVGSGNVAEALTRAISGDKDREIVQVFARNPERGAFLAGIAGCGWEDNPERLAPADIYLLAVSDRAIQEVSESLDFKEGLVVHTSGSAAWTELSPETNRRGVFYPLQTFTAGRAVDFKEIPIFIESENETDLPKLEDLAASISGSVLRSSLETRQKLHVAAVFVCNFVNDMYVIGENWMRENGMDFSLLKPLIGETTRKMLESRSAFDIQTGPAAREDYPTIEKHLEQLEAFPDEKEVYQLITNHIIKLKHNHGKL